MGRIIAVIIISSRTILVLIISPVIPAIIASILRLIIGIVSVAIVSPELPIIIRRAVIVVGITIAGTVIISARTIAN